MKNFLIVLAIAGLGYIGYVTWSQHQKAEETAEVPAPQAIPTALSTPPVPAAQQETAAVHVKHTAPDGVYYLLERISITTDSGVIADIPGTKVTLEKENGTTLTVTDGSNHFDVSNTQVTNDLDVAAKYSSAQAAQGTALAAWTQEQKRAGAAADQQHVQQLDSANKQQEKNAAIAALQGQLSTLSQQEGNLRAQIAADHDARMRHFEHPNRVETELPTNADVTALGQQLNQVVQSEAAIQNQIAQLQR